MGGGPETFGVVKGGTSFFSVGQRGAVPYGGKFWVHCEKKLSQKEFQNEPKKVTMEPIPETPMIFVLA